jgi:hypothetical protein
MRNVISFLLFSLFLHKSAQAQQHEFSYGLGYMRNLSSYSEIAESSTDYVYVYSIPHPQGGNQPFYQRRGGKYISSSSEKIKNSLVQNVGYSFTYKFKKAAIRVGCTIGINQQKIETLRNLKFEAERVIDTVSNVYPYCRICRFFPSEGFFSSLLLVHSIPLQLRIPLRRWDFGVGIEGCFPMFINQKYETKIAGRDNSPSDFPKTGFGKLGFGTNASVIYRVKSYGFEFGASQQFVNQFRENSDYYAAIKPFQVYLKTMIRLK